MDTKPGKLQTVAIIWIVDGAMSIVWGAALAIGALASIIGIICLPIAVYPLVLGIVEVIYGVKLFGDPVKLTKPPIFVSIMEMVDIAFGDVLGLIAGIVTYALLNDEEVKAYFAQRSG